MEIKDIESVFMASPVARTNWASHVIMLNSSLPLGVSYWYMKQSVEMGWSSNALKIQIETNLYSRQISNNKVNNFTATLPAPQSDLANYLLKDPYIFDLAGTKEKASSAPATLAAQAKVEFSSPVPAKSSITDGLVPADENDRSISSKSIYPCRTLKMFSFAKSVVGRALW